VGNLNAWQQPNILIGDPADPDVKTPAISHVYLYIRHQPV